MPVRGDAKGQDWTPVVFERKRAAKEASGASAASEVSRPCCGVGAMRLLEEESEELSHLRVSAELKTALMQARVSKGLSQKELAAQLNMPYTTIVSLEGGKALVDNALVARIERHLCCTLPRTRKKPRKEVVK